MELYISTVIFILGTIFGSFLNVVIYRLPQKESIIVGRSHCPKCQQMIPPSGLIPIVSYVFLSGKCKDCKASISIRYPLIEGLTGILFLISYLTFGISVQLLIALPLAMILIVIAMIDIDTLEIYDRFQVMLFILALINLIISPLPWIDHVIGFFIISTPFYIIALVTNGMGGGDIKLIAIAGFLLGYQATLVTFFISTLTGSLWAFYLLIIKKSGRKTQLPFGPFLCIGIYIAYHYSDVITQTYLNFWL
ncbi:MAG: prepilin peptidase [Erysipelothrix sp.]|nr:prepilin peptidase [Erysipelothrix sp.]